ncbi:Uncharacterised protein [uncultured archaeon]|nr:Uncharacterised protein [uncultured archaeon]
MEHEKFPVEGFGFMDEPATDKQKTIFCDLAEKLGQEVSREGPWPVPFSKWDAGQAISRLQEQIETKRTAEPAMWTLLTTELETRKDIVASIDSLIETLAGTPTIPTSMFNDVLLCFKTYLEGTRNLTNLVRQAIVPEGVNEDQNEHMAIDHSGLQLCENCIAGNHEQCSKCECGCS